jgi:radical SAM superfamily enzyme YgiQ (UPF0313 family)
MRIAYATLLPTDAHEPDRFVRPPLTAGYLASYSSAHRRGPDNHDIVEATELDALPDLNAVASRMLESDPQIVGLSVYVWNHVEVAEVCRRIRHLAPTVKIVLGGPEVAFTPSQALRIFEADWVCTGEGEIPFLNLLNALEGDSRFQDSLPGLLHRCSLTATSAPAASLVKNLDDIPSPYRTNFLRIDSDVCTDLETTRGCPYRCRFCLYGKTLESLRHFSLQRVELDVTHAMEHSATSIYLMDPTFNYPRQRCKEICRLLASLNPDRTVEFSTEVRAEIVDEEMADLFVKAGIRSVEIGLQSVSQEALKLMRRGLGTKHFIHGCKLLYERGIQAEIGMIIGLPGDTRDSILRTADFVLAHNLGELNVYRLQMLPGSEYHKMAAEFSLQYDPTPPYYIQKTPTLNQQQITSLVEELEDSSSDHNDAYNKDIKRISYNVSRRHKRAREKVTIYNAGNVASLATRATP